MKTRLLSLVSALVLITASAFVLPNKKQAIVINVAHGGHDQGAEYEGQSEGQILRAFVAEVQKQAEAKGIKLQWVGAEDTFVKLQDRLLQIQALKPDLFYDLHIGFTKNATVKGPHIYASTKREMTDVYLADAKKMQKSLTAAIGSCEISQQQHFLTSRVEDCPAFTLELGYLSNSDDRKLLLTEEGRTRLAQAFLAGLPL